MSDVITTEITKSPGRPAKPESEKLVLVGSKIPPEMRQSLMDIALSRGWSISEAVRAACESFLKLEQGKLEEKKSTG